MAADPAFLDARINLGLLLHQSGALAKAERAYCEGLADCHYNLALLCEDLGKPKEALRHLAQYRRLTRG